MWRLEKTFSTNGDFVGRGSRLKEHKVGEANRRGTFEQHKAQAIVRRGKEQP